MCICGKKSNYWHDTCHKIINRKSPRKEATSAHSPPRSGVGVRSFAIWATVSWIRLQKTLNNMAVGYRICKTVHQHKKLRCRRYSSFLNTCWCLSRVPLLPLSFILCMDVKSEDLLTPHPWTLFYTDDFMIASWCENRADLKNLLGDWKGKLEQYCDVSLLK